ncbi:nitrous oxide reductase accessory protein NosL [Bacillus sp. JJ864]|uniref:nitrous oxide reductase accessory protein NosL n=1 Tax=Bacillus sp. JJ864 TaxID=3122975 RepID=UPI002FFD85F9
MKWKGLFITIVAALLLTVVGCGKKEVKPVAIDEKNDKCANCNMLVTNDQFGTEVILENGKSLKFDDLGCMYKWMNKNKNEKLQAKFVRDYNTKEWVEVEKATYVYDKEIKTPMAYNVISFKDKKDADSFVSKNKGEVLVAKDLEKHEWNKNMDMMMKIKEENAKKKDMNHSH